MLFGFEIEISFLSSSECACEFGHDVFLALGSRSRSHISRMCLPKLVGVRTRCCLVLRSRSRFFHLRNVLVSSDTMFFGRDLDRTSPECACQNLWEFVHDVVWL